MTTASLVSINCRACGLTSTVRVDALLVSVAVDDHGTTTRILDADVDGTVDNAGTIAWPCGGCADLTTAHLDWPALLTLVTAGATVLATVQARTPDPEQPSAPPPLTRDDLLALYELLASDTWFDQVTTTGCVNP